MDILRKGFSSNDIDTFHYEPFESYWIPPGAGVGAKQRIYSKIHSSPVMLEEHWKIQTLKISDLTCTLPRCIAAFMFSSNTVQFGAFTHAKGWPIFGYFGNVSKSKRCKPLLHTCYHVAHIPTVCTIRSYLKHGLI